MDYRSGFSGPSSGAFFGPCLSTRLGWRKSSFPRSLAHLSLCCARLLSHERNLRQQGVHEQLILRSKRYGRTNLTIMPLASAEPSLAMFGGKGRSLARLAAAGLPVPRGFLVSTSVYKSFVEANELQELYPADCRRRRAEQPESMELASASIRALFEAAALSS